jgi:hypothetical protein
MTACPTGTVTLVRPAKVTRRIVPADAVGLLGAAGKATVA